MASSNPKAPLAARFRQLQAQLRNAHTDILKIQERCELADEQFETSAAQRDYGLADTARVLDDMLTDCLRLPLAFTMLATSPVRDEPTGILESLPPLALDNAWQVYHRLAECVRTAVCCLSEWSDAMGRLGLEMDRLSEGDGCSAMKFDTLAEAIIVPDLRQATDKLDRRADDFLDMM
jgi:hypothetical protein